MNMSKAADEHLDDTGLSSLMTGASPGGDPQMQQEDVDLDVGSHLQVTGEQLELPLAAIDEDLPEAEGATHNFAEADGDEAADSFQ